MRVDFIDKFKSLFDIRKRYVLLYGGRGGGKSQAVARALILQGYSQKYLILCTREKQNSINESVYSLLKSVINEYIQNKIIKENTVFIKSDEISFYNGTRFIFKGLSNMTKDNIKSLEGVDICWVEEASSITKETLDTLLPTIRKEGSRIIFTYNRNRLFDPVHESLALNPSENTVVQRINYYDNPYFPKVLEEERLRCKQNEIEEVYNHIWLGEPYIEENVLINTSLLNKSFKEFKSDNYKFYSVIMGVDVARSGNDKSVLCFRQGNRVIDIIKLKGLDGNELSNEIIKYSKVYNVRYIMIDSIGVGASPCDFLRAKGYKYFPINFGEKAEDERYFNKRAECYVRLKNAMVDGLEIKEDMELKNQLEYIPIDTQSEKIKLVKKEKIKEKLGYSPDVADSLALTYGVMVNDFTENSLYNKTRSKSWQGKF